MNRQAMFSALIMATLVLVGFPVAANVPKEYAFQTFSWGDSSGVLDSARERRAEGDRLRWYTRDNEDDRLGSLWVASIWFGFLDDELIEIEVVLNEPLSSVIPVLRARYGEPVHLSATGAVWETGYSVVTAVRLHATFVIIRDAARVEELRVYREEVALEKAAEDAASW